MSVLTTYKQHTIADVAQRIDAQGKQVRIAEVLMSRNPAFQDAPWFESNEVFSNVTARRAYEPAGQRRKLNDGYAKSATQVRKIVDTVEMVGDRCQVDKKIADSMPNKKEYMNGEAAAFIRGISGTAETDTFYGNSQTDPEQMNGFHVRTRSLAATTNVIGCGGTGSDLTSCYIVQWGRDACHFVYPRGSMAGIEHTPLGLGECDGETSGTKFLGYRDYYELAFGLVAADEKCLARLANIETGYNTTSNTINEDYLIYLLNRMRNGGTGAYIYVNQEVKSRMEVRLKDKTNVHYTARKGEGIAGEEWLYFRGCPVRVSDKILLTEAALT